MTWKNWIESTNYGSGDISVDGDIMRLSDCACLYTAESTHGNARNINGSDLIFDGQAYAWYGF